MQLKPGLFLNARWPYLTVAMVGGLIAGFVLMMWGALRANWVLLPLGALIVLLVAYAYAASTWIMQRMLDFRTIAATVWQLAALSRSEKLLYIETGQRNIAIEVSKFLLNGRITIIDVFDPQLMPDGSLLRLRKVAYENVIMPLSDPRTVWIDGILDRLPRLDNSAKVVVLDQVLCEMVQHGDRKRLLDEIYRVLEPGGRLIVVERLATSSNRWLAGIGGVNGWHSAEFWQQAIQQSHFSATTVEPINALLAAFLAIKPKPQPRQLELPIFAEQKVGQLSLRN